MIQLGLEWWQFNLGILSFKIDQSIVLPNELINQTDWSYLNLILSHQSISSALTLLHCKNLIFIHDPSLIHFLSSQFPRLSPLLLMAADKAAISLEEIKNETVDLVCSLSTIYLQVFLLQNPLIFFYFSVSASFHYPFPFTLAEKSWDFSIIIAKCSTCTPFFPLTVLIHSIFFLFFFLSDSLILRWCTFMNYEVQWHIIEPLRFLILLLITMFFGFFF